MAKPYPFSAIVGQDEMKDALLMAAVEPSLGGVLVFGDRGTGKSTAVRALAELVPELAGTKGCRYNCDPAHPADPCPVCATAPKSARIKTRAPMVDLPLGATEDRVCGALDIEKALVSGERAFEPGLLAKAHRGFLYVDEVNLLEDHLVDLLLDVAASGVNVVEREGLSVRHPARFVLVGSGNPEEGELRPQLLDRFGLSVDVSSPRDIASRIEVLKRRDAYEQDAESFHARNGRRTNSASPRELSPDARRVGSVALSDRLMTMMAHLCMQLGVDGLRGELTLMRAARAKAALSRRKEATLEDVLAVAPMALRHRLRRDPLDEAGSKTRVDRAISEVAGEPVGHA
jgi:magnesium chelatase subunit I